MMNDARCEGTTTRGTACRQRTAIEADDDGRMMCLFHSVRPERVARIADMRSRGGLTPPRLKPEPAPPPPETIEELGAFIAWAMRQAGRGQLREGVLRQIRELAEMFVACDAIVLKKRKAGL